MAQAQRRPASRDSARPRTRLERASAPILIRLHALPRWLFPGIMALLLVGGLLTSSPALSALLLGLVAALLSWLIALSWPLLRWPARLMRLIVVGMLVVLITSRLSGPIA